MASSLNGLTVGDSLAENLREYPANLRESPARSENGTYNQRGPIDRLVGKRSCYSDDMSPQYSPMSEDSDDSRFCDISTNSTSFHPDFTTNPTSPVSPYRSQRLPAGPVAASIYTLPSCTLSTVACSHPRQRGSETDNRFPSSPNDVCHTADLRRAALLRSVQIRTQGEERPFSCSKTLEDDVVYHIPEREAAEDYIEECSSVGVINESNLDGDQ
ncbi:hypothetical protein AXF42_Ash016438 [Apostasia shenzhenica]|uniref:Uncharacterized protein n=1 Tax=Apostasia shenzhenica TaxID=1088818 RepID=A0A2I0A063_9ASPA|nr:hypothetical protein AXF42_Ash016438 [Apostasia shenzhenica]